MRFHPFLFFPFRFQLEILQVIFGDGKTIIEDQHPHRDLVPVRVCEILLKRGNASLCLFPSIPVKEVNDLFSFFIPRCLSKIGFLNALEHIWVVPNEPIQLARGYSLEQEFLQLLDARDGHAALPKFFDDLEPDIIDEAESPPALAFTALVVEDAFRFLMVEGAVVYTDLAAEEDLFGEFISQFADLGQLACAEVLL
ncbi:MAG: hypothetical protein AAGN35_13155 [Bacteroidota bacterium]